MRETYKIDKKRKKNKGKRNRKLDAFLKIIAFIYVVVTIIFYISVVKMDLLPGMYVTVFTIAEIVFTFAMTVGLIKNHKKPTMNIVCLIIILLLSGIYIYITNYALATGNFLDNVFKEVAETEEYYVIVRKDSSYIKIEDISNKDIYLFQAVDDVKNEVSNKANVNYKTENSLTDLGNNLLNKKTDAIFVSSVQYDILSEEIKNFKQNTKILYTAKHEIKKNVDTTNSKDTIKNGVFNVYISGIDTSGSISNVARSDANILATVNTKTHEVLLTSIPRDYYVTLHTYGAKDKLTHSGIYGINETVSTIEDLLNIDINYYVRVNFSTVIKLVDTLGGVDVYSDYDFTSNAAMAYHFNKGYNHVNGVEALAFSRERYSFAEGDNQRVKNQQHVIEAIMKKVLNSTTLLTKYTDILDSLEGSFQTNIKQDEISSLVKGQLNNMSSWTIKSNSLTGTGANNPTYSMGSQLLYTMVPDATSISEAKEKIQNVMKSKE